jgi:hypothetical protein
MERYKITYFSKASRKKKKIRDFLGGLTPSPNDRCP